MHSFTIRSFPKLSLVNHLNSNIRLTVALISKISELCATNEEMSNNASVLQEEIISHSCFNDLCISSSSGKENRKYNLRSFRQISPMRKKFVRWVRDGELVSTNSSFLFVKLPDVVIATTLLYFDVRAVIARCSHEPPYQKDMEFVNQRLSQIPL